MDWRLSVVSPGSELVQLAALATQLAPERPYSADELEHAGRTYPGGERWLAWAGARPVGYATVGRIYVYAPDFDGAWGEIGVVDDFRRRGIGGELYRLISIHAAAMGKVALHVPACDARPEAIGWLERRGFTEIERSHSLALDLRGVDVPAVDAPADVEITTLAARPDLLDALYDVSDATSGDIPGSAVPHTAGTFEEWVAYDVDGPMARREAIFIALVDGEIAGYASLCVPGADPTTAWHDMTGVMPAFRGRGIAGALKRSAIVWAAANGFVRLETENNVGNAPMRAINAALGYAPLPDQIILRGPLADL